jgi:hypothetical protein
MGLSESVVETAALSWLGELGYAVDQALHLAPEESAADAQGEAEDEVGRARSAGRESGAHRSRRRRSGAALRSPARSDGRQSDDRLHEPPHLRADV